MTGGVGSVVQAGCVSQPEDLLKQVSGEVVEGGSEDKVAYLSVLLVAVVAEIDEVLDVVVGADELDVLTKTESRQCSEEHFRTNIYIRLFSFYIFFCFSAIKMKTKKPDNNCGIKLSQHPVHVFKHVFLE